MARNELPYGADRLLLLWGAEQARARGRSFSFHPGEVSEYFELGWPDEEIRERLRRVWNAHVEVEADGYRMTRCSFVLHLEKEHDGYRIELGPLFRPERLIPLSAAVLAGCARRRRMAALDMYLWQAVAGHGLERPVRVEVFGPGGVQEQLGGAIRDRCKVRQQLRERQELITSLDPSIRNHLSGDGNVFILEPAGGSR